MSLEFLHCCNFNANLMLVKAIAITLISTDSKCHTKGTTNTVLIKSNGNVNVTEASKISQHLNSLPPAYVVRTTGGYVFTGVCLLNF